MISQWEHHIPAITCDEGIRCDSTRIYLFYFDDNFRRYSLETVGLSRRGCYGTVDYKWTLRALEAISSLLHAAAQH